MIRRRLRYAGLPRRPVSPSPLSIGRHQVPLLVLAEEAGSHLSMRMPRARAYRQLSRRRDSRLTSPTGVLSTRGNGPSRRSTRRLTSARAPLTPRAIQRTWNAMRHSLQRSSCRRHRSLVLGRSMPLICWPETTQSRMRCQSYRRMDFLLRS